LHMSWQQRAKNRSRDGAQQIAAQREPWLIVFLLWLHKLNLTKVV